eukprot:CAMPEP_0171265310 /NCGR_PEP_ID=MMETSP0790-20130122/58056_1 /TAXON_ID=2925 /ORGANISM="Alexandrium catenella, Strain OF101" /LENGTH=45 /DNA_ID= /DNA_START= /DNA_END= /DNA_ORIENTATION=
MSAKGMKQCVGGGRYTRERAMVDAHRKSSKVSPFLSTPSHVSRSL